MPEKRTSLSLRHNFSWTLVGNVAYTACQWGVLVVLAKLGSPVLVGQFALGLAVTAPIFVFLNMQLRAVQVTDAQDQFSFGDYLGLRVATVFIGLNLIVGIVLVFHPNRQSALVILFLGFAKGCESLSDILYGMMQRQERMDRIAKSMIIKGLVSLVSIGFVVYFTRSAVWGAATLTLAWAAVLLAYDVPSGVWVAKTQSEFPAEPLWPRWERETMRTLALLALPLGVVVMLVSFNSSVTRYFVQGYCGTRQLGIFAALAYVQGAAATIEDAMAQSALPRLSRSYAAGNREAFCSLLRTLLILGAALGLCGVTVAAFASKPLLTIVYGPEYALHSRVFLWVMMAICVNFMASFMLYAVTAARHFRSQLPVSLTVALSTVLFCVYFIPTFGILGAAYTLLAAAVVRALLATVLLTRALGYLPEMVPSF